MKVDIGASSGADGGGNDNGDAADAALAWDLLRQVHEAAGVPGPFEATEAGVQGLVSHVALLHRFMTAMGRLARLSDPGPPVGVSQKVA